MRMICSNFFIFILSLLLVASRYTLQPLLQSSARQVPSHPPLRCWSSRRRRHTRHKWKMMIYLNQFLQFLLLCSAREILNNIFIFLTWLDIIAIDWSLSSIRIAKNTFSFTTKCNCDSLARKKLNGMKCDWSGNDDWNIGQASLNDDDFLLSLISVQIACWLR